MRAFEHLFVCLVQQKYCLCWIWLLIHFVLGTLSHVTPWRGPLLFLSLPWKKERDFKPSNLSLWQMVHAKTGLVSQRDHPKSAYYQKVVVKIAQWNLEESMLWNTFMIISESLLDLWSAFHCYVLGDSSYMSFMLGKVPLESWRSLLKRHCRG